MDEKRKLISVILIAASVVAAVISFIVLPQTVMIQFSVGEGANTTAPKALAVLIPTLLGIGGGVFGILTRADDKTYRKSIFVSAIGIVVFIIMIAAN